MLYPEFFCKTIIQNEQDEVKKLKLYNPKFIFTDKFKEVKKIEDDFAKENYEWIENEERQLTEEQLSYKRRRKLLNYVLPFRNNIEYEFGLDRKKGFTNAWRKMYEVCQRTDFIPRDKKNIRHLDLCGFPGTFVLAINHFIKTKLKDVKYDWYIQSYLGEEKDVFLKDSYQLAKYYPKRMLVKENGDIRNITEIEYLMDFFKEKKCDIITSDCGLDREMSPDGYEREKQMNDTFIGQYYAGIGCLAKGGNFFMKYYHLYSKFGLSILYLMSINFEKVILVKPEASRQFGGKEIYIMCLGFRDNMIDGWKDVITNQDLSKIIISPSQINNELIYKMQDILADYYLLQLKRTRDKYKYTDNLIREDPYKDWKLYKVRLDEVWKKDQNNIFHWFVRYFKRMKYQKIKDEDKLVY